MISIRSIVLVVALLLIGFTFHLTAQTSTQDSKDEQAKQLLLAVNFIIENLEYIPAEDLAQKIIYLAFQNEESFNIFIDMMATIRTAILANAEDNDVEYLENIELDDSEAQEFENDELLIKSQAGTTFSVSATKDAIAIKRGLFMIYNQVQKAQYISFLYDQMLASDMDSVDCDETPFRNLCLRFKEKVSKNYN